MPNPNPAPTPEIRKRKTDIRLLDTTISIYSNSQKLANALAEISADMTVYHGAKLSQIMEAIYVQGKKDGAREMAGSIEVAMEKISYRNPGQPKKRR
jgi:hypothetical protein